MEQLPEVEVDGATYRIGALPAMTQFHVARRLAPALAAMGKATQSLDPALPKEAWIMSAVAPMFEVIAGMSDAEAEYVIKACLAVVARKQDDGRFAPTLAPSGQFMFADIGMTTMIRLTVEVVRGNLGSFIGALVAGQL